MPVEELEAPAEVEAGAGDEIDANDGAEGEETPTESTDIEGEDPSEEDAESEEEAEPVEGEENAEPVAADGRKMPDALKKGIAALKTTNPEAAKAIKGLFFADQEYRAVFPKPADAVAAKTLIDTVGGPEGIQQIESERQEWAEIDRAAAEGKADFVKSIAENNPEAFPKLATAAINEWATRHPEQYGHYATQVALNTVLAQPGMEAGLQTLFTLHDQLKEVPWAQQAIAQVVNGIVGLKEKASQYESKRLDPERTKLDQEKQAFAQTQRASFEDGVYQKATAHLNEKMPAALATVINGRKVDAEAMNGFKEMVDREVQKRLGAIPGFADKLEAHYRTGNAAEAVKYITNQYNTILPEAAKVIAPFLRNIPAVKEKPVANGTKPNGERQPVSPGTITLKEMPDWEQLDPTWRARPEATADLMMGKAVLKGGKKATGWA